MPCVFPARYTRLTLRTQLVNKAPWYISGRSPAPVFRRTLHFSTALMPSKQATLGYVKPSQSTIGKFFGNGPGDVSKTPSQQSKLKFSSKATSDDVTEERLESENAVTDVKLEDNEIQLRGSHLKTEPQSTGDPHPRIGAKRKSVEASEHDSESDIAPPSKKKKQNLPDVAKQTAKVKVEVEDGSNSRPTDSLQRTKTPECEVHSSPPVVAATKSKSKSGKGVAKKKAPTTEPQGAKVSGHADVEHKGNENTAIHGRTGSGSDAELDDAHDDDDDNAADAADAERLQYKMSGSKAKDLYPDWPLAQPVPFAALCTTLSKIEMTTKRLEILELCSRFIQQVTRLSPQYLYHTVLLMLGKLAADYSGIELGIGESLIMKAIGETTGRSLQIIKADQQEIGDLGLVAVKSRSNQPTMFKPKPLTVHGVHEGLMQIALVEGQGSQGRKVAAIKKLLAAADVAAAGKGSKTVDVNTDKGGTSESKFLVRLLEGKMRLGLAEKTLLSALANAMVHHFLVNHKSRGPDQFVKGEEILKSVFNELPSYDVIIPALMKAGGIFKLRESCKLQPGVPLKPMLARPTKSITEVLDRFEGKAFTCEYKYDGERAQIHFVSHEAKKTDTLVDVTSTMPAAGVTEKGISNIFSRNSEDLSKKYPDILAKLPDWVGDGVRSFVLDCETVAWDMVEKKVLPFQQLMTRKRKDVKTEDIKVKVCVFAFDLLYLNGEALVNKSLRERRDAMYKAFNLVEGEFAFAQYGNCSELDEIQTMLEESIKASCEGLMVKMLDDVESHYEPSRRSQNWLKVKKDYLAGAGDSLDLVVLGAYYGKGKRTSVYGAFLLACWNPATELFETVCNIGTGFSDEALARLHESLSPLVIARAKPFYSHSTGKTDQPDVWFEPKFVWEVKTADLTLSPRYKAAADQPMIGEANGGKGVSLRFPRYIRDRDDKKPEDATTSRQVADMYKRQDVVGKASKAGVDDDFEY